MTAHRILAIRYGHHDRKAAANFVDGDDHDTDMPLDYYVWAILRDDAPPIVVDTGFDAETSARRGRTLLRPVADGLAAAGIDVAEVEDVIVTHLHFDHAGSLGDLSEARFHIQDTEMAFATSRAMTDRGVRAPFDAKPVAEMVHMLFGDRVVFHAGREEVAPGVIVHHLGGHTAGLQTVEVATARGPVLLASDAAHLYANLVQRIPFPIFVDRGEYLASLDRLLAIAPGLDHVIPGHDPIVLEAFPPVPGVADMVRVDLPPARAILEYL